MGRILTGHVPRRLGAVIDARLAEEPVVALQGPRTVGKSTLLSDVARVCNTSVFDLDDLATRDAVAADPGLFTSGPPPVCIDEYQHVPDLLDAIKAELNRDLRPGRFVLTGSTRYEALPQAAQALTGRLHLITVYPLSQGEVDGVRENFLERVLAEPESVVAAGVSETSRTDYVERVTAGGMPLMLQRLPPARGRWADDYVALTLDRDVREIARVRQRHQLPRLLERLAGQTGQVLNIARAARDVRMDAETAENYARLLEAVFLLLRLPAWGTTLRARAAATPKIHVIDSGLGARLLRLTPEKLAQLDPTSLTQFGHLLESFAVLEILKQASWLDGIAGLGHWRTHDHDEVDVVVERDDGRIFGFEVKSGTRVPGGDLRGLRKLRDAVGEAFVAGFALYLGSRAYTYDERVHVLPLDRLWTELA